MALDLVVRSLRFMKPKQLWQTLVLVVAVFAASVSAKTNELRIVVEPASESRFRFSISFEGDADGSTTLVMPNQWGGQRELYKAISNPSLSPRWDGKSIVGFEVTRAAKSQN